MRIRSTKTPIGAGKILGVAALLLIVLAGSGFYRNQNADLNNLTRVLEDLPSKMVANEIVKPDYTHAPINDSVYAVPGHYTIIVYRQTNCAECARLDIDLEKFLKLRRDVAVRKIDLVSPWSENTALHDFGRRIWFTPFVVIYGADGRQIRADNGGKRDAAYLLYDWLKSEFAKENEVIGLRPAVRSGASIGHLRPDPSGYWPAVSAPTAQISSK